MSSTISECNDMICENVPPPPSPEQPPNAPHDPVDPGPQAGGQGWPDVFAADGYRLYCDWSKLGSQEKMQYSGNIALKISAQQGSGGKDAAIRRLAFCSDGSAPACFWQRRSVQAGRISTSNLQATAR